MNYQDLGKQNRLRFITLMNKFIHKDSELFSYHMNHIRLTSKYALLLNKRLSLYIDPYKLEYISLVHDLFKERSLDSNIGFVEWKGYRIPHNLNRYVRLNLDILEEYKLDEYFNTDINLHPLAAGIFLHKELNIRDPEIIYPVMFHSCPIISVYEALDPKIQNMIDIIMLSDKLSSNHLRINSRGIKVRADLDLMVFGESGHELNYSLGLYIARLISQGVSREIQSLTSTEYYYNKLCNQNSLMSKSISLKKLGSNKLWPKRRGVIPINNLLNERNEN